VIRSRVLGLFLLLLVIGGCATSRDAGKPADSSIGPSQVNADNARVVNCLLPGQIRRLGTRLTYVTPRRTIKTTSGDCDIRGGESAGLERAGYATAVEVW
jgi:hypothetical protein